MDENLTIEILKSVETLGSVTSTLLASELNIPHQKIVGAIKSLESLGNVVEVHQSSCKVWQLTDEGKSVCDNGSLEAQLFDLIPSDGISLAELKSIFQMADVAMGYAFKQKWIRKDGARIIGIAEKIHDKTQDDLKVISRGGTVNDKSAAEYKKRQLIISVPQTDFKVSKGSDFRTKIEKQVTDITKEMIESGQWKTINFKPYNFNAKGKLDRGGYLHPLMQLKSEFKQVFIEMGFTEMPTNNYVESAFWNFDALFQPQQHPARDAQDTFYVSNPSKALSVPKDYMEKVKKVHTVGDYGSIGYQSPWSESEAHQNLLRTHTTAVSARLLKKLAEDGFKPAKYFSIDKVYRNETLDATHLAEFHQVEGIMAGVRLSMQDLMGTISEFFRKIGIRDISFKPTYNPYTQPSMEIYTHHEGLNKLVEVGNSGYFRPEMLRTMGLPEDATVAGWGLSLERPAMIMCGINNIRELVGSKVKMELIMDNPICTIDKFGRKNENRTAERLLSERQRAILQKLSILKEKCRQLTEQNGNSVGLLRSGAPLELVVNACPLKVPHCLKSFASILLSSTAVDFELQIHPNVKGLKDEHLYFWKGLNQTSKNPKVRLCLLWTPENEGPMLTVSRSVEISGESNISRYLARLIESCSQSKIYEKLGTNLASRVDYWLDKCDFIELSSKREQYEFMNNISQTLQESPYLCGDVITLADLVIMSLLKRLPMSNSTDIQNWTNRCQTSLNMN